MSMSQPMQVLTSRNTHEWYTPLHIIELARSLMGDIDLDPASAILPQTWIKADQYYTVAENGLLPAWYGRIWLNAPFDNTAQWVDKLINEYAVGNVKEAMLLVNSNAGYMWYENLWCSFPCCCLRERLRFVNEQGIIDGQAKRAQTIVYFGKQLAQFELLFSPLGRVLFPKSISC